MSTDTTPDGCYTCSLLGSEDTPGHAHSFDDLALAEQIERDVRPHRCRAMWEMVAAAKAATPKAVAPSPSTDVLGGLLGNLLAQIHGDGGHHTHRVGVVQSAADAEAAWCSRSAEIDALKTEVAELRASLSAPNEVEAQ